MQSLAEVKAGKDYTIKWMFVSIWIQELMSRYGIQEGSDIRVLQQSKSSTVIGREHWRLAIGNDVAEKIKV